MKEIAGWNNEKFTTLHFKYGDQSIDGSSIPYADVHFALRENGRGCLPYKLVHRCEAVNREIIYAATDFHEYYKYFVGKILELDAMESVVPPSLAALLSEVFFNAIEHGVDKELKGEFLTIEHYHPLNPSKMILRVSNPKAKEWDYRKQVRMYLEYLEKTKDPIQKGIGRGGFHTFNATQNALVSYENGGKDFLALIDLLKENTPL